MFDFSAKSVGNSISLASYDPKYIHEFVNVLNAESDFRGSLG